MPYISACQKFPAAPLAQLLPIETPPDHATGQENRGLNKELEMALNPQFQAYTPQTLHPANTKP